MVVPYKLRGSAVPARNHRYGIVSEYLGLLANRVGQNVDRKRGDACVLQVVSYGHNNFHGPDKTAGDAAAQGVSRHNGNPGGAHGAPRGQRQCREARAHLGPPPRLLLHAADPSKRPCQAAPRPQKGRVRGVRRGAQGHAGICIYGNHGRPGRCKGAVSRPRPVCHARLRGAKNPASH